MLRRLLPEGSNLLPANLFSSLGPGTQGVPSKCGLQVLRSRFQLSEVALWRLSEVSFLAFSLAILV